MRIMGICDKLCSMPHGRFILLPLVISAGACILSFRIFASCDLVKTDWSIDCSTALTPNCVFLAEIEMGFLAKQTFVAKEDAENNTVEMMKVCQWYGPNEKKWLWDGFWRIALISFATCIITGFCGVFTLGMTSCCSMTPGLRKGLSIIFGLIAIFNVMPMMVYWSRICQEESICNESQSNCVNSCRMGSGSWHIFASSFMWISAMITTWSIGPSTHSIPEDVSDKDAESQESGDTSPTRVPQPRVDDDDDDSVDEEELSDVSITDEEIAKEPQESTTRGSRLTKVWSKIRSKHDKVVADPADNNMLEVESSQNDNKTDDTTYRQATFFSKLGPQIKNNGWENL